MNLRTGNNTDMEYILNIRPQAAAYFEGRSYFIVVEDGGILGFVVVFHRDIEAPVPANEAFINLIEILDERNHRKGIASRLVQKIILFNFIICVVIFTSSVYNKNVIVPHRNPNKNVKECFYGTIDFI